MAKSLKNLPTLTMGDFAELKGSIEASKGRNSGPQIGTFTPKSAVSEADLRDLTARVDELFANEEWEDCERRYRRLVNELKLGPVKNQGRFALTLAHLQKYEEAVELAVKTYKELPSESASYEALALCTRENKDLLQTGLWSRLADLAASHPSLSLQELSVSATRELEMFRDNVESTRHLILKPDLLEKLNQPHCANIRAFVDMNSLEQAIKAVQRKPERLSQEAQHSASLRFLMDQLAHDSTSVFPPDYDSEHAELKQANTPFHSISRDVFLKILKNLNLVFVARLRKTCRLFSHWANHPQYWEAILTHYCDPIPEIEWGIPRQPSQWSRTVKTLRAEMAGLAALGKLLVNEKEVTAKIVDVMYPVARRFNTYESDRDSCGASSVFDRINDLIISGGAKTAHFFVSATHLIPVLGWFLTHGNDPHHSIKDSMSAVQLITSLIMKGGDLVLNAFRAIRLNLPATCIVPTSFQSYDRWTLLSLILASNRIATGAPHSQILPLLSLVQNASPAHQARFSETVNGYFDTILFVTAIPDLEHDVELGMVQIDQKQGSDQFSVQGADTLGSISVSDGLHRLMHGTIEFNRKIGERNVRFIGKSHPFAFGGAFFDIEEDGSVAERPLGIWAWYHSKSVTGAADDAGAFKSTVKTFTKKASRRTNHPLLRPLSSTEPDSVSEESHYLNQIRQYHATAVALESPLVLRSYMEETAKSLSFVDYQEASLPYESDLDRFRVETDFKYARRKDLHHRAVALANIWRLRICALYADSLLSDATKIEEELDLLMPTAKLDQPITQRWSRLLVIFKSALLPKLLREAHDMVSKGLAKAERRLAPGKEEAATSASDSESSPIGFTNNSDATSNSEGSLSDSESIPKSDTQRKTPSRQIDPVVINHTTFKTPDSSPSSNHVSSESDSPKPSANAQGETMPGVVQGQGFFISELEKDGSATMSSLSASEAEDVSGERSRSSLIPQASRSPVFSESGDAGSRDETSPSERDETGAMLVERIGGGPSAVNDRSIVPVPPPKSRFPYVKAIVGVSFIALAALGTAAYVAVKRHGGAESFKKEMLKSINSHLTYLQQVSLEFQSFIQHKLIDYFDSNSVV